MKVKILSNVAHATKILHKGSSQELPDDLAKSLIDRKLAKEDASTEPKGQDQDKSKGK